LIVEILNSGAVKESGELFVDLVQNIVNLKSRAEKIMD